MPLYHRVIGFPSPLRIPMGDILLQNSFHARQQAYERRITIPAIVNLADATIIEVETDWHGRVVKTVARFPYDRLRDLTIVMLTNGAVKTVWLNDVDDEHETLDLTRYDRP